MVFSKIRFFLWTICNFLICCEFFSSCIGGCPYVKKQHAVVLEEPIPLDEVNNLFLTQYYPSARAALLEITKDYPLITLYNGNLTLTLNQEIIDTFYYTPALYTRLKEVSHILFSSFLNLEPLVYDLPSTQEVQVDTNTLTNIKIFRMKLNFVNDSLATCCNFTEAVLYRQYLLLQMAMDFLDEILLHPVISQDRLTAFTNSTTPLISQNINDSAIAQLNLVHSRVMEWKAKLTTDQWNKLHVLYVGASHMARHLELFAQYFARLLDSPINSGLRLIYAEDINSLDDAIILLGTHLIDFAAGKAFFSDPEHMHTDVLAKAAHDYIPKILPNNTQSVERN